MSRELWKSDTAQYLIPKGTPLLAGDIQLRNNAGQTLLVDEQAVRPYIASEEDIKIYQQEELENALSGIGAAFGNLFQTGKQLFVEALKEASQNMQDLSSEEDDEENLEDIEDEISDLPPLDEDTVSELDEDDEDDEDPFADIATVLNESVGDLQDIFQEAKDEFQKAIATEDTITLLRSVGSKILNFANDLEQNNTTSEEAQSEEDEDENPEEPPLPDKE